MPFSVTPPPMPPASQPLIDTQTGLMAAPWYTYFKSLTAWLVKMGAAIP